MDFNMFNLNYITKYFALVKFLHSIFSLPFAVIGFAAGVVSYNNFPELSVYIHVLLCVVFARNSAMAFNRYIDRKFDSLNPRTLNREIPTKTIKSKSALTFAIINGLLFIATSYLINNICFYLSPVALFIILFYSYTKRISYLSHFVLGVALMIAPMGAFLAVTSNFSTEMIFLSLAVLFWVAGFDIIYSLQDMKFDKEFGLHSIPAKFGANIAIKISQITHVVSVVFLIIWSLKSSHINLFGYIGVLIFIVLLIRLHTLVKPVLFQKIESNFLFYNGFASVQLSVFFLLDIFFFVN